jgi:cyclic pyranopterin monophosphate synthase
MYVGRLRGNAGSEILMSTSKESSSNPDSKSGQVATGLTHVNSDGEARMVDVGGKAETKRQATASSSIFMSREAATAIRENTIAKGDCLQVARIAAIQASKQTSVLIPLCHLIQIDSVEVQHTWLSETELQWCVTVKSTGSTGVEMEALTAASIAALTVYDMCKAIDRSMTISNVMLLSKKGGARGNYQRKE